MLASSKKFAALIVFLGAALLGSLSSAADSQGTAGVNDDQVKAEAAVAELVRQGYIKTDSTGRITLGHLLRRLLKKIEAPDDGSGIKNPADWSLKGNDGGGF